VNSGAGLVRAALRAFDGFRPDVLVSDIGMPHEDGYTLIRHVRAREKPGPKRLEGLGRGRHTAEAAPRHL
jgi:CheY-like chemotaxis protein